MASRRRFDLLLGMVKYMLGERSAQKSKSAIKRMSWLVFSQMVVGESREVLGPKGRLMAG